MADDTYRTLEGLRALGEDTWFRLGDTDLATHLKRTQLLQSGRTLTEATAEIAESFGLQCTLLPMSDDRVRTMVTTNAGELSFQEYFVRRGQRDEVLSLRFEGADEARPAAGVLAAIREADAVVIAPSNPLVSIGPILALPGLRDVLRETGAPVGAVSPIVGGKALKGPADRMMRSLGNEASALGVARMYADLLDVLVLDSQDEALASDVASLGIRPVVTDTIMRDVESKRSLAQATLNAVLG
jgi:LPPG:FO 2-phospho-L-lactate transferase